MVRLEPVFIEQKASDIIDIVRELRAKGLVQGVDFEFRYQQEDIDGFTYEKTRPRGAEFYFRDGKWRTYFQIKYA